jgi:transcriptional regulator with XRE-family HTH domain
MTTALVPTQSVDRPFPETFAVFLDNQMTILGKTQDDMAVDLELDHETAIDRATISKWKTGKSHPSQKQIIILAQYFGYELSNFKRFVEASRKLSIENVNSGILGNYELVQHSFMRNNKFMKTNINVSSKNKVSLQYKEQVQFFSGSQAIEGHVVKSMPHLVFHGIGLDSFHEHECIMMRVPRHEGEILYGVIVGVAGNTSKTPSACRVVLKYLGKDKPFSSDPWYLTEDEMKSAGHSVDEEIMAYLKDENAFQSHVLHGDKDQ